MLRAIVFDFDGVIANSEPLHFRGYRDVLAGEGIALSERDYYAHYLGFDDVGAFEAIGDRQGTAWSSRATKIYTTPLIPSRQSTETISAQT